MQWRNPTKGEIDAIEKVLDVEEGTGNSGIDKTRVIIGTNYMPDGPSWAGRFALVMGGEVCYHAIYRFARNLPNGAERDEIEIYGYGEVTQWNEFKGAFTGGEYVTYSGRTAVVLMTNAPGVWPLKGLIYTNKDRTDSYACEWDAKGVAAGGFSSSNNIRRA